MKLFHKVLIVDDDPASTYLNQIIIEEAEISEHIISIENGGDALTFIEEHCIKRLQDCPNLILLDLHMPVLDGIELIAELKTRGKADLISNHIVVITSSIHNKDINDLKKLGVKSIIEKPLTKEKLDALIQPLKNSSIT